MALSLINTLTLAFSVQPVKASYPINGMMPVSKSKERQVTVSFSIPQATKIGRYDWLKIENCSYFTKPGQPMLPVRSVVVKLPERSTVTNVRVKIKETLLKGSFSILPVPLPTTVDSQTLGKIREDLTIYKSKSLFPKEWHVYREAHGMDAETNTRVKYLILNLFPLRYLPAENKVIRAEKISATITYIESPEILTPLTGLKNLIVASPALEAYALELADWKNNTGVSSKVLNTIWIYDHYSGVDNQEKIRNCIKDFVATYGIIYVTIFGDADQVPVRYVYVPDDYDTYTPTDLYYADLDGTWDDNGDGLYADQRYDEVDGIPDVYIGRIPPSLVEYAQVAVDKIKGYQQQFDTSQNWTQRIVLGAGTGSGDGFTNPFGNATTVLKEYIADVASDKDIVKLYESAGNLSTASMTSEINKGALFVNFAGHGDPGTGLVAVGWLFYWVVPGLIWNGFGISDAQSLTNGFKLPVVTTMACSTARFDDTDCIGEWFVLEPDGGSIAYFGATRVAYGWPDESSPYGLMGEMDRRIYENFYEGCTRLGQMWGETVGEYVQNNIWDYQSASKYDVKTFMEFVLLGDPALRIYNPNYPETLNVPEDFPTIQTAINATYDGDTVLVSAGTYYEHIVVNKTVSIVGENRETTIIDGNRTSQAIVQITADDVTFSNFTVQHAGKMGFTNQAEAVYLRGTGISVTYNIIRDNNKGIFIYPPSRSNRIIGNVVTGSYFFGINCGSSNNTISDNLVTGNIPYDGIILTSWMKGYPYPPGEYWPSGGNVLRNNNMTLNGANFGVKYGGTIYNNVLYLPPVSAFVQDIDTSNTVDGKPVYYLVNQSNMEIDDLSFPNMGYLGLVSCRNVTVRDFILTTSNYQGILFVNVTGSAIENIYTNTGRNQISLVWSNDNVITKSTFMNAWSGIHLVGSDNNTVCQNDIAYGTTYGSGVRLDKSIRNVIIENSIGFNKYGIRIFQGSIQNVVYHNNLISNAIQLDGEPSQNVWDNGYEGNYWSDYNGTDINGDGIGDTYLPWHGVDYYPLMNSYRGHNIAIVIVKTNKTIVGQGFTVRIEVNITNTGSFPETSNLTVYVNTTAIQTQNVTLASGNSTTITFTWNTNGFAKGNYTITAYAEPVPSETDTADNTYVDGTVKIVDTNPPMINLLSPQNKTYYSDIVPLTFEITEPASWIGYSLDNQLNVTIIGNTFIDVEDGTHQIIVYADDISGNTGSSQIVYFTVNSSFYDPWETSFIGLGGFPIVDFAFCNEKLYAASDNTLYVYNGSNWSIIDAPTYVTSLMCYEDKLIVGGKDGLYSYNGTAFTLILPVSGYIKALGIYNNTLYAGTVLDKPPTLYYCNSSAEVPDNWHIDTDFSTILNFSGSFGSIDSFAVYNNKMYISSGGTVYFYNGTDWGIAKTYNDVCVYLDMKTYKGKLYLATRDQAWRKPYYQERSGFSGRVIEFDGNNWTTVFDYDYWIYSLGTYYDKLYVGTANKIYTYNGTDWSISFNAVEGAYYALSFITFDDKIYVGMGNGYIFADPSSDPMNAESVTIPEFSQSLMLLLTLTFASLAVVIRKIAGKHRRRDTLSNQ